MRCLAVPEGWTLALLVRAGEHFLQTVTQRFRIVADQRAGALVDGDRPFGIGAGGETGDAQHRRFLLQTAGGGHDHLGLRRETEEIEIPSRRQGQQPGGTPKAEPSGNNVSRDGNSYAILWYDRYH